MEISNLPIAVTSGDPAGVGGELTLQVWKRLSCHNDFSFFLIADVPWIKSLGEKFSVPICPVENIADVPSLFRSCLPVLHTPLSIPPITGVPDKQNSRAILDSVTTAFHLLHKKQVRGIVTNPVNKAIIKSGTEINFSGHTGFLRDLSQVKTTAMMLITNSMLVVPVTLHIPLSHVSKILTKELIIETALLATEMAERLLKKAPRIAISALNPHCGEDGYLGTEEIEIINPAIKTLRNNYHLDISDPISGDVIFTPNICKACDLILCMYHDQALAVPKTLHFFNSVNLTLGLPFIRTSPGHGVAYDIAGQNKACPDSLHQAILRAHELTSRSRNSVIDS
jgi:4-hydroxythreonine-4-phosphate dehydrogenase